MPRYGSVTSAANMGLLLLASVLASAQATPTGNESTTARAGYAEVNGLDMYYEIHGNGRPLVLLHGTLSAIGTSFGALIPSLAETRQVIAVEQQGHGRTADIDRPLSYEQMAEDTDALLRHLGIERADFFGYSMGAVVAMRIASQHPDRVRRLVLASAISSTDGFDPEGFAAIRALRPEDWIGSPFQEEYAMLSPHPNERTLVAKVKSLLIGFRGWSADELRSIRAPVLIVIGDSGIVLPEHAVELFRLLSGGGDDRSGPPNAQLAIIPGMTHVEFVHHSEFLVPMVSTFLDAPLPEPR